MFRLEHIFVFNSVGFVDEASMASWNDSRSCKFLPCSSEIFPSTKNVEMSRKNIFCRLSRKKKERKKKDFLDEFRTNDFVSQIADEVKVGVGERLSERLDRWFGVWKRGRCSSSVRHFIQKKNTIRHGG